METRIDLSISSSYVPDWGVIEAVREIVQNALDMQTVDPDNCMYLDYCEDKNTLTIASKDSVLERSSLLMGHSTKRDAAQTIGKFGEGYKLALMALVREGHLVTINNYYKEEQWIPSIKHSNQFDAKVLSINVKKVIFPPVTDTNLAFLIEGITPDIMSNITKANLNFGDYPEHIKTKKGNILISPDQRGRIYVKGLYIETSQEENISFGYDLAPEQISLDRDRTMISSFSLFWLTSNIWASTNRTDDVLAMLKDKAPDVKNISNHCCGTHPMAEAAYLEFIAKHGEGSHPVTYQSEYDSLKTKGLNPIICADEYTNLIRQSMNYAEPPVAERDSATPEEILQDFKETFASGFPDDAYDRLDEIIALAETWL